MGKQDLQYLIAICKAHKVFTREEEIAVARRARKGDRAAVSKMTAHNIALVISVVRKYNRGDRTSSKANQRAAAATRMEDLIQEGMLGLLRAIKGFDPDKGNRFSTYATWWIRAYVTRAIKGPEGAALIKHGLPCSSIDDLVHGGTTQTLGDTFASPDLSPIQALTSADFQRRVQAHMDRVKPRRSLATAPPRATRSRGGSGLGQMGWAIYKDRLASDTPRTLNNIGVEFGVSRERVRQIEVKVKKFLKTYLAEMNDETDETA